MMRYIIILFFLLGSLPVLSAQVSTSSDFEFAQECMVDSLSDGTLVRFVRVRSITTGNTKDFTATLDTIYEPQGNVITCQAADNAFPDTFTVRMVQEVCQVQNIPDLIRLDNNNYTHLAGTQHSVSLTVISGTSVVTVDGKPVTVPEGITLTWTAPGECDFIAANIAINATGATVITTSIR